MRYLFDTNVLIYYINGVFTEPEADTIDGMLEESFEVSIISKLEFLGWKGHSAESFSEAQAFMANARILQLDDAIADKVVELKRQLPIKLPDAIIAATSLVSGAILVTRNVRDFSMIEKIRTMNPFTDS